MGKAQCQKCNKKCSGEVLRVQDRYFHIDCFKCKECSKSLAQGGFFSRDGEYFCAQDYQGLFGTKCGICHNYVEGEVVSALGNTYHQKCFVCARCRQPFPSGERVTFTGKECLCQKCIQIPVVSSMSPVRQTSPKHAVDSLGPKCAGCHEELNEGQALIALDKQWHIWCFKCASCGVVLHGEYMGKDGLPYCEKDYQIKFGVKCAHCERYISGKVLQAGDNYQFHPTCARCSKCGDPFGDGEEMYLQGTAIWHPRCGPGPNMQNGQGNGHVLVDGGGIEREDGIGDILGQQSYAHSRSSSLGSNDSLHENFKKYVRMPSPGLFRRDYSQDSPTPHYPDVDITRIYTCSYLTAEPTQGYLKRPLEPRPPKSPQFHRPQDQSRRVYTPKAMGPKPGMKVLVDSMQQVVPRPKSPQMNNEEPIEMAHYPDARKPGPKEIPKIERDDFPAPPFPYTDPERRRRWSDTYKGVSDDEEDLDDVDGNEEVRLKKEEQELTKIATGIGKVFLQNVKEREKLRQWKMSHMDPRNASRTPSANKEPPLKLRYDNPINASPSRNMERPKLWEDDLDRSYGHSVYHGPRSYSVGRSYGAIPNYNVITSARATPKPGYGLRSYTPTPKSATLPATGRNGGFGDYGYDDLNKTRSTDFSSGKSDISTGSVGESDRNVTNADRNRNRTFSSTPYSALRCVSYSPHLRRSLPTLAHMSNEPPKIYPVHLLSTANYRLPVEVDRCHLERHLSNEDFEGVFRMSRVDFYRLPEWRRNDLKKRAGLY